MEHPKWPNLTDWRSTGAFFSVESKSDLPPPKKSTTLPIIFARVVGVFWLIGWCSVFRSGIWVVRRPPVSSVFLWFFDRKREIFKLTLLELISENSAKLIFYPKNSNFFMSFY